MSLAVLCPGQGGQHPAMLDLFDDAAIRSLLARAPDVTAALAGPAARLFDNAIAQPLLCAAQWIAWSVIGARLEVDGIVPALFAGYSVGELAACGCAGALSFDETLRLARVRARAMDAASARGDGLVALRGLMRADVAALCAGHEGHVAIVNGDDQVVVGGSASALDAIERAALGRGAATQRLMVVVAAHTPLLTAAVAPFNAALEATTWGSFRTPVVAGVDGSLVRHGARAIEVLSAQLATTIRWDACMGALVERGVTACLELGPGNALSRLMQGRHPGITARSVADFRSIDAVVRWVERSVQ